AGSPVNVQLTGAAGTMTMPDWLLANAGFDASVTLNDCVPAVSNARLNPLRPPLLAPNAKSEGRIPRPSELLKWIRSAKPVARLPKTSNAETAMPVICPATSADGTSETLNCAAISDVTFTNWLLLARVVRSDAVSTGENVLVCVRVSVAVNACVPPSAA